MTKSDRLGPGLTDEQWDRLKALATTLTPEQSNWVGGYFTGFADAARRQSPQIGLVEALPPASAPAVAAQRSLTVLYGSETGNSLLLAEEIASRAVTLGLKASAIDMADYKAASIRQEQDLLIVTSTHGEGDPPQAALSFFEAIEKKRAPRLEGLRFAVLALGDSTYEFYCEAGKRLDARLHELGAERLAPRIDCDVDQLNLGKSWAGQLIDKLAADATATAAVPAAAASVPAPAMSPDYSPANPFQAAVLENLVITGRGSSKETRHLELSLEGSGLTYEPGDALGIVGRNDPRLVAELLDSLKLDGSAKVTTEGGVTTLAQALESSFEIATATPRFVSHWAKLSEAAELVVIDGDAAERSRYLETHHIGDIVRQFPVPGLSPDAFITGLRGLQPRLYSIASSQAAVDGDVHLTVSTVRYSLHGSERNGVVSGALGRLPEEASLPVYVKANPHFRLPADDAPMLMIGAGTGVAPYRGFVQERAQRGATGRSWLVFGDRNFRSDFLYQAEWQEHLKRGELSLMDAVFSRDGGTKTYVQHRLRERSYEVFGWLQDGAHLYVCGDAKGMAPAVHDALLEIVRLCGGHDAEGAEAYLRELQRAGRYQRDVY